MIKHSPGFALKDPFVTRNATFADLLSHQSGLRTGAGDLLEDLGFDQSYILSHLNQQPLDSFRASYNYSNFGYTAGAQAAADAMNALGRPRRGRLVQAPGHDRHELSPRGLRKGPEQGADPCARR